jgi:hypothetical protein
MRMHTATPDAGTTRDWSLFARLIDAQRDFWPDHVAAGCSSFRANVECRLAVCSAEGVA